MKTTDKVNLMKNRLNTLEKNPKNVKSGGCVRALRREIRNLEKAI